MRVRNSCVLHICALVVMISITVSSAHATFSNASLKGGYSFLINRWTINSNEPAFAEVGVLTFDGAGNVTASYTKMDGGVEGTGTGSGTYTVSSNGSGTITASSSQYAIVVNSSAAGLAKGIALLRIDTNYPSDETETGTAVLQSTTAVTYSLAKLKGNLGFQLNTWTPDPNVKQSFLAGIFSFNGAGTVKGSVTNRKGGVVETQTFTGTYTVNSDGSGTMSLTITGGGTAQLSFALNTVTSTGPAKGMQLLATDETSNEATTGVALKQ